MSDALTPPQDQNARKREQAERDRTVYLGYLEHNPYVKPWMKPYLPENIRLRDLTVTAVGTLLGGAASYGAYLLLHQLGFETLGIATDAVGSAVTLWLFPATDFGRRLGASTKVILERKAYERTKKQMQ